MVGYSLRGDADNVKVPERNNNRQRTRREDMIGDVKLILGRSSSTPVVIISIWNALQAR